MEMVERVARALVRNGTGELVFESWDAEMQSVFLRQARAAIEAMREPTDAQLAAFTRSCDTQGQCLVKYGYTAMIDAALSQTIGDDDV